jgi:uncharacterized protein (DUF1499 family)
MLFLALALACVLGAAAAFRFSLRPAWFTQNDVTTGASPAYPDLPARVYPQEPDRVFQVLRETAARVPRWRVVAEDPAARSVKVEVTTAFFSFVDDLEARVEPEGSGSRVVIRSRSRVGKGDLGENFRHVRALQERMDSSLR